jgi:hypothetical protein
MCNYRLLIALLFSLALLQGGKDAQGSGDDDSVQIAHLERISTSVPISIRESSFTQSTLVRARAAVSHLTSVFPSETMSKCAKAGVLAIAVGGVSALPPLLAFMSNQSGNLRYASFAVNCFFMSYLWCASFIAAKVKLKHLGYYLPQTSIMTAATIAAYFYMTSLKTYCQYINIVATFIASFVNLGALGALNNPDCCKCCCD